ncbi:D-threonate kinase [Pantoea stewartii]|uniref:Membrane protein n=1 Tax=Pantoea stewartii TaxID=66269 RepID=A0AB34VGE8_9GAMM|nr:four-carbon acid sugar kinase family protein [Pantoea stewartii]KTS75062.1 membrane protein [Pantoea stewartii]KTS98224.1 membrane protein [Pantoea stewartii]KTT05638.1 membrane protein [Pantoea stewartii]
MKMIVIADDFTGANDTGVQLAKKGARTEVMLTSQQKPSRRADVLVINTDSRALSAEQAAVAVKQALSPWVRPGQNSVLIYKKIDSTFRGNPGAEIAAAMAASGTTLAIVAAAIPSAGRMTRNGECWVHQHPLLETEFASDPRTPIISSRIRTLIGLQTDLPVREMTLDDVRRGDLADRLENLRQQPASIVIIDAESDNDLALIARAALSMAARPLLVGAAGLANALPTDSYMDSDQTLPVLVVAGSMSEMTRRQVAQAQRLGRADVVRIAVETLLAPEKEQKEIVEQACQILAQNRHCVLQTSSHGDDRNQIAALTGKYALSREALGETLSRRMGDITLAILDRARTGGLFLTGGDIAIAVANALGAEGYRIHGEVAPCIPCGTFVNSDIDDLPVITKAGGFGTDDTLCDALHYIEELYLNE